MGYDPDITKPSYAVIGLSGAITNERVLTGTTNKITITDGGAGGSVTFNTGSLVVHTDQANTYSTGNQDFSSVSIVSGIIRPSTRDTYDIGTTTHTYRNIYLGPGSGATSHRLEGNTATGQRIHTFPDANSNTVIPDTGAANNFLTAISSGGVISKAQPSVSNLSDGSQVVKTNQANTYSTGTQNFDSVTTVLGSVTVSGTFTPDSNGAYDLGAADFGFRDIYLKDSAGGGNITMKITCSSLSASDKTFTLPNANCNPVVPSSAGTDQFATAISSAGVITWSSIANIGPVGLKGTITPDTANSYDIGTANVGLRDIYLGGASNFTVQITKTTPTADRVFTLPDANSNAVIPTTSTSNQYLTHIDSSGVQNKSTISTSNLSDGTNLVKNNQANTYSGGGSQDFGSSNISTTGNVQAGNVVAVSSFIGPYTQAPGGRLTLLSLVACPSSDQTAKTTVYYTPDVSNQITFPNYLNLGVQYTQKFSEASLTVPSTTNTNYDVFAVPGPTATTITLAASAWSSDTLRATQISKLSNGVWVSASNDRHIYLGSFRTTGVSGQTEDSAARRLVYNAYNRRDCMLRAVDTTDSWTISSSTVREWNSASTDGVSRVAYLQGLVEDCFNVILHSTFSVSNTARTYYISIGLDSSTASISNVVNGELVAAATGSHRAKHLATYAGFLDEGYHTIRSLEANTNNAASITVYGDNAGTFQFSGLLVTWRN